MSLHYCFINSKLLAPDGFWGQSKRITVSAEPSLAKSKLKWAADQFVHCFYLWVLLVTVYVHTSVHLARMGRVVEFDRTCGVQRKNPQVSFHHIIILVICLGSWQTVLPFGAVRIVFNYTNDVF